MQRDIIGRRSRQMLISDSQQFVKLPNRTEMYSGLTFNCFYMCFGIKTSLLAGWKLPMQPTCDLVWLVLQAPICLVQTKSEMRGCFGLHGLWTVLSCGLKCSPICFVCPCSLCAEVHPSLHVPGLYVRLLQSVLGLCLWKKLPYPGKSPVYVYLNMVMHSFWRRPFLEFLFVFCNIGLIVFHPSKLLCCSHVQGWSRSIMMFSIPSVISLVLFFLFSSFFLSFSVPPGRWVTYLRAPHWQSTQTPTSTSSLNPSHRTATAALPAPLAAPWEAD